MNANPSARRSQVQVASGLNLLAGIWLILSAYVVSTHGSMQTNNVICGIAVAALAAIRAFGAYDQGWLSWVNAAIGVWVVVSPWAVTGPGQAGPTTGIIINNCVTGGLMIIFGNWSALATETAVGSLSYSPEARRPAGR